jgi:hypothetical protein
MAAHRKLAADFGHQADAVVRAARERSQHQKKPVNSLDRVRESLTFSRDKNFEREAVVDERALIRDGLRRGMGEITHAQVRANLEARLASGEFQIVERPQSVPGRQFTTARTIEAEHEIIRRVREGQNHTEPVLPRPQAIAVADQHPHLSSVQRTVVEDLLSSPDRIQAASAIRKMMVFAGRISKAFQFGGSSKFHVCISTHPGFQGASSGHDTTTSSY